MSKKILAFLSAPPKDPSGTTEYTAPDGTRWAGEWTNDAPLRYLLKRYGKDVERVICVVTEQAKPTYERLQGLLARWAEEDGPETVLHPIWYQEGHPFEKSALSDILDCLRPGDQILLETTGGFRNIVIDMLLLSRILAYRGIRTVEAVYSNHQTKTLEDVTHMYHRFDLVSGMQELTSFGSARTLRSYYERHDAPPPVQELMAAMEGLKESIALCRTKQLPDRMERFNQALLAAEGCGDPMLKALLPAFREKFGESMTTLPLIRWCLGSGMLQQALTIYNELTPELIYGQGKLIWSVGAHELAPGEKYYKAYLSHEVNQLLGSVLKMNETYPHMRRNRRREWPYLDFGDMRTGYGKSLFRLGELMHYIGYAGGVGVDQLQKILADFVYIRTLRNMTNHAGGSGQKERDQLSDLNDICGTPGGYRLPEDLGGSDLEELLMRAVQRLESALQSVESRKTSMAGGGKE